MKRANEMERKSEQEYMHVCVRVCVRVSVWKKEREWESKKNRATFLYAVFRAGVPHLTLLPNFCDWLYTLRYDHIRKKAIARQRITKTFNSSCDSRTTSLPKNYFIINLFGTVEKLPDAIIVLRHLDIFQRVSDYCGKSSVFFSGEDGRWDLAVRSDSIQGTIHRSYSR